MTKTKHPSNKYVRRLIETNKFKTNEEKRAEAKDRTGKVRRKLTKVRLQEWETEDELRRFAENGEHLSG